MLAQMRSRKFVKRVMKWTLILVIPSFVFFYGWGDMSGGGGGDGRLPYHAKIKAAQGEWGWDEIREPDLKRAQDALANEFSQLRMSGEPARFIDTHSALRFAVNERLIDRLGDEYGFMGTAEEVADFYLKNFPGKSNAEISAMIMGSQQYANVPHFEARLRNETRLMKISGAIGVHVRPSMHEVWDNYRMGTQKIAVSYAKFDSQDYRKQVEVTTDSVKQYFAEHREDYRTGDQAKYRFVSVRKMDLTKDLKVTTETIQAYYNAHSQKEGDEYWQDQQVRASHIMFTLAQDASDTETSRVMRNATEVYKKLEADPKHDFVKLANLYSQDSNNTLRGSKQGGKLRPISAANPSGFGQIFDKAALVLEQGLWTMPLKCERGIHIIKADRVDKAGPKPLIAVRTQIEWNIKRERAEKLFGELYQEMAAGWNKVTDLGTLATNLRLEVQESDWVDVAPMYLEGAGYLADFQQEIRRLKMNAYTPAPLISEQMGFALIIQLIDTRPPYDPPLEKVRLRVDNDYRQSQAAQLAIAAGKAFMATIGEGDLLTSKTPATTATIETAEAFDRFSYQQALKNMTLPGFQFDTLGVTTGTVGFSYLTDVEKPQGCCIWQVTEVGKIDEEEFENQHLGIGMRSQNAYSRILMQEYLADARKATPIELHPEFEEREPEAREPAPGPGDAVTSATQK